MILQKQKTSQQQKASQSRYWTPEEHIRFLDALVKFGHKDVKSISQYVQTRNPTQVRTHAQKFYLRLGREAQRSREKIDADRSGRKMDNDLFSTSPDSKTSMTPSKRDREDDTPSALTEYMPRDWKDEDYGQLKAIFESEPFVSEPDIMKKCTEISRSHMPQYTPEELELIYYKVYVEETRGRGMPNAKFQATSPMMQQQQHGQMISPIRSQRSAARQINVTPYSDESNAVAALTALSQSPPPSMKRPRTLRAGEHHHDPLSVSVGGTPTGMQTPPSPGTLLAMSPTNAVVQFPAWSPLGNMSLSPLASPGNAVFAQMLEMATLPSQPGGYNTSSQLQQHISQMPVLTPTTAAAFGLMSPTSSAINMMNLPGMNLPTPSASQLQHMNAADLLMGLASTPVAAPNGVMSSSIPATPQGQQQQFTLPSQPIPQQQQQQQQGQGQDQSVPLVEEVGQDQQSQQTQQPIITEPTCHPSTNWQAEQELRPQGNSVDMSTGNIGLFSQPQQPHDAA